MPKLSIIVPVYYNEGNLPQTVPALVEVASRAKSFEVEFIYIDDGSKDRSFELLESYAGADSRIKLIKLSKNFGAYSAILAGLDIATGDCITIIMADLQDPPDLILEMLTFWEKGSKIVIGERIEREDQLIDSLFAQSFWRFIRRFGYPDVPKGGFDYVLFDRQVLKILTTTRERNSHIMLQIFGTGFSKTIIPYVRKERKVGKSKWTFAKKFKLFVDSAISFTFFPIRFMSFVGLLFSIGGILFALYVIILRLTGQTTLPGWSSLIVVLLLVSGMQMLVNSLLGEYLWRIFDATRNRPLYIVEKSVSSPSDRYEA